MSNHSPEPWYTDLKEIADDLFRVTTATHKRRVALKHGVRESSELEADCPHEGWDTTKYWCNDCGITAMEIIEAKP